MRFKCKYQFKEKQSSNKSWEKTQNATFTTILFSVKFMVYKVAMQET